MVNTLSMLNLPVDAQRTGRIQGLGSAIRIIEEERERLREAGLTIEDTLLMDVALKIQKRMLEE